MRSKIQNQESAIGLDTPWETISSFLRQYMNWQIVYYLQLYETIFDNSQFNNLSGLDKLSHILQGKNIVLCLMPDPY